MAHTTYSRKKASRTSSSRSTAGASNRRTPGSSKSGSPRQRAIDAPFAPALLDQAREIAGQYRILVEPGDDPNYVGYPLELPNCFGGGETAEEAFEEIREAATTLVAYLLEKGETPPPPFSGAKRSEQINIRVTAEEKLRIESVAQREGFRGASDFVRTRALAEE